MEKYISKATNTQRRDDPMWKAVLEDLFVHFLSFYFPDALHLFDLKKGFVYMDKEFDKLFPPETSRKGVRYVDKLVKVFLKNGGERHILIHIEVQSHKGKGDLAERMYTYFYLIKDKYNVPVTAIAILSDGNRSYRPNTYKQECLGTSLTYKFNIYKIIDQDETSLRTNPNPFAIVVLTTLLAIRHRNVTDEGLKNIKHDLYEEMMKRKLTKEERKGVYNFLAHYVRFANSEMLRIFEQEVEQKKEGVLLWVPNNIYLKKPKVRAFRKASRKVSRKKVMPWLKI